MSNIFKSPAVTTHRNAQHNIHTKTVAYPISEAAYKFRKL